MSKEYLLKNLEGKTFKESKRFGRFSLVCSDTKKYLEELYIDNKINCYQYFGYLEGTSL